MRADVQAVALEVAVQAGAADAEDLRRSEAVAIAHLEDFLDVVLAHFIERKRMPVLVIGEPGAAMLEMLGQIADINEIAGGGDTRGGNDVFQFADVAGPGMLEEKSLRAAGEAGDVFAIGIVVLFQEKLDEQGNVFQAFRERRNTNLDRTQTIEEILAETAGEDFGAKIAIGGGNEAHIDLLDFGRADPLNFAVLDDAQQLGLHGQGSLADFIQEHRAAIGVLEEARASIRGAGEGAADMAEQLTLQKGVDQGGAVADRQALLADRADLVDGAGHEFLARASGAHEENIGVVAGNLAREVEDFEHGGAFADNTVEFEVFEELFLQRADAAALIVKGGNLVEGALQTDVIDGFGKEIGGAAADGLESVVEGVIGGHDNEVDAGITAQRTVKKLKGVGILQVNAGQDKAGAARADEAQSFLGVAGGDGLIAHVRNKRG